MFLGAHNLIFENAKALRNAPTHAEIIMWSYLKQRPLKYKFRRQHPISIYMADFYCHSLKLIIEIDGSIHDTEEARIHDIERRNYLEREGIKFLRFTNLGVEKKLESVILAIEDYINNYPKKEINK